MTMVMSMASDVASGCRTIGSTVRCELAAPEAAELSVPQSIAHKPVTKAATADRAHHTRAKVRGVAGSASPNPVVDDATAWQHIASLIAIGDCTGARTYANLIGKTELADQAFNGCVGLASASPSELVSTP
jgi:hypothetical protein